MSIKKNERINFNVTNAQKKELLKRAEDRKQNLTDFIISSCLNDEITQDHYQQTIAQLELDHALEKLQDREQQITELKNDLTSLKATYEITLNAMLWHSLPFYKKIGKRLQLNNKED